MKRLFSVIVIAIALLLLGCGGQGDVWFDGGFDQAKSQAMADGKLIAIDFYSPT